MHAYLEVMFLVVLYILHKLATVLYIYIYTTRDIMPRYLCLNPFSLEMQTIVLTFIFVKNYFGAECIVIYENLLNIYFGLLSVMS